MQLGTLQLTTSAIVESIRRPATGSGRRGVSVLKASRVPADTARMTTPSPTQADPISSLPEANALYTHCPICQAPRYEPCTGGNGVSHTARELLRVAELEAVTPVD